MKANATIDLNLLKTMLDNETIDQRAYDELVNSAVRLGNSIGDFVDKTIATAKNPTKTRLELIYLAVKSLYPDVVNTTLELPENFNPENILGSISKIVYWKERNVKEKNAEGYTLSNMILALNKLEETEVSLVDAIPTNEVEPEAIPEYNIRPEAEEEVEKTDEEATIIKPKKK